MSWAASDIADWWDEQHRLSKKAMDRFVDDNPNLFGVIVGTAIVTSMELGAGMVDALRFGQGAADGGVGGYAKDAVRLIGLMGPLGKVAKYANILRGARLSRLIVDPGANGLCSWVSSAIALTKTATKLKGSGSVFTTVEDLAATLGVRLSQLEAGFPFYDLVRVLKALGAKIGPYKPISALNDIARLARNDGSVVMVGLKGVRKVMVNGVLKEIEGGHTIAVYRDILGRLRFLDRGGGPGRLPEVLTTLEEIAAKYKIIGKFEPRAAVVMENVFVKIVGGFGELTMPAFFTTQALTQKQNETIAQAFEVHKKVVETGPKAVETPKARHHTVVSGDWLSKIAHTFYGDMHKWPVIYMANKDVIGRDPDLIKPGQKLVIPELPKVPQTGTMY